MPGLSQTQEAQPPQSWAPDAAKRVRGVGPRDARLVVIGEAPGRDEVAEGQPFVGAAGRLQRDHGWHPVGLQRRDLRIENVVEVRPLGNQIARVSPSQMRWWQADLHARIAALKPGTWEPAPVLVPCGNIALNTLRRTPLPIKRAKGGAESWRLREGSIQWGDKIGNWRGSIFPYIDTGGRLWKVMPTVHPASLFRNPASYACWKGDWVKIAAERELREWPVLSLDDWDHVVEDVAEWEEWVACVVGRRGEHTVACDIENHGPDILCLGAAVEEDESMVVGLTPSWWTERGGKRACARAWAALRRLLASPIRKTFHQGWHDTYLLEWHGCPTRAYWWDTSAMHNQLDPRDRHSLAYCSSRDLRTAYWKDEAKEGELGPRGGLAKKWTRNLFQLMKYCGKDARHTLALQPVYEQRLRDRGMLDLYHEEKRRVIWAGMDLSRTGIAVDEDARAAHERHWQSEVERLGHALDAGAGMKLLAKKGLSNPAIHRYFYGVLKCKERRKRGRVTADEVAIRRLMLAYKRARHVGQLILDFRQASKHLEFLNGARVDADGRLRSLYKPMTKTGRYMASTTPVGTGTNGQNLMAGVRDIFIASPEE